MGFVVLVAAVVFAWFVSMIAVIVAKNHQISMAMMGFSFYTQHSCHFGKHH